MLAAKDKTTPGCYNKVNRKRIFPRFYEGRRLYPYGTLFL